MEQKKHETTIILPEIKANYPRGTIPAFNFPSLTPEVVEKYKDQQFVLSTIRGGGLPVVIAINPDRLHVYNDTVEFKYNAFNHDIYAKAIGEHEVMLRNDLPGNVLFGRMYQESNIIRLFHIWNTVKSAWLDTRQIEMLRRTLVRLSEKVRLPEVETIDTLENLRQSIYFDPTHGLKNFWIFIKSVNDPGLFFVRGIVTNKEN